ncbi:MAG: HD domain-containing protein [Deltaproteobacteria bacterium]|nr:HD domain-containing protein [Deltaproteobacteria bacterium]
MLLLPAASSRCYAVIYSFSISGCYEIRPVGRPIGPGKRRCCGPRATGAVPVGFNLASELSDLNPHKDAKLLLSDRFFNILAVDDDEGLQDIYKDILESAPVNIAAPVGAGQSECIEAPCFRVTCRSQAKETVAVVRESVAQGEPFAAVFLDVNLPPGPSGIWAAGEILRIDPAVNIVLVTGYIGSELGNLPRQLTFSDRLMFLQKPFHPQEIVQFASALSAKWSAERQVRSLNANLEGLVRRRTAELQDSNEMLRREVDRRCQVQQELQQSLDRLRKIIGGAVMAIAMTVEKRDPYTSGHQQRVAALSCAIGKEMGLSSDRVEGLTIASAIHDIGKISLPAEILTKPSQLNRMEMGLVQAHAQAGYEILHNVDFPWPVADIVLQHHERMNGTGYPQHLMGDAILKEARIVSVADVVETMSSHRPYRPARGLDSALGEISAQRGILYDADAVDSCLTLMQEGRFEFASPVFA